jgi:hypothetical protein
MEAYDEEPAGAQTRDRSLGESADTLLSIPLPRPAANALRETIEPLVQEGAAARRAHGRSAHTGHSGSVSGEGLLHGRGRLLGDSTKGLGS